LREVVISLGADVAKLEVEDRVAFVLLEFARDFGQMAFGLGAEDLDRNFAP
jgi:hypothetical protein